MKKYKELVLGNSLYMLCISPYNDEPICIINCLVHSINNKGTVLGVRYINKENGDWLINYFRVNPESYINDSLKEDKEHRLLALFETKEKAVECYINYCEDKIKQYTENINKIGNLI